MQNGQIKPKRIINIKKLAQLYIDENYSMELLAEKYMISLPIMSRILWKFDLPTRKQLFYRDKGGVKNEVAPTKKGKKNRPADITESYSDSDFNPNAGISAEEQFFSKEV